MQPPVMPARLLNGCIEGTVITVQHPDTGAVITGGLVMTEMLFDPIRIRIRVQMSVDNYSVFMDLEPEHPWVIEANRPADVEQMPTADRPQLDIMVRGVPARSLNGTHLDRNVRFSWQFPTTGVYAVITAQLVEIHHDHEGVTLWVTGTDTGSKQEFILAAGHLVEVGA